MNASSQTTINFNLERLRFVAVFGIVWFHFEHIALRTIAYSGLPVFLLLSSALVARHDGSGGFAEFAKKKWARLMVPWLAWCAVYAFPKMFEVAIRHEQVSQVFTWTMVLGGTRAHLWYLPFVFAVSLGIYGVLPAVGVLRPSMVVFTALAAGCVGIVVSSLLMQYHATIPSPFAQWIFALPAVALGFAFGRVQWGHFPEKRKLFFAGTGVATVLLCSALFAVGLHRLAVPYACGAALVCCAFIRPGNTKRFMVSLAPLTFGIYLMYPLVSYVPDAIMPSAVIEIKAVVTFAISLGAAFVLSKTPARRFI
jgi:peptidoglycan/LPS O-acetylase OafA/YrhL